MNIKTIVKVMNFHALIRVDRARRDAEQYAMLEGEVRKLIDIILNNRNLILDKRILNAPKDAPRLRIYMGSDLGFCGGANSGVNALLAEETGQNHVIIVGRKIHKPEFTTLYIPREEFSHRFDEIAQMVAQGIGQRRYSAIELCYDHYTNLSHIQPVVQRIYPIQTTADAGNKGHDQDFSFEGADVDRLLEEMIVACLNYEIKIAAVNSFASENILRQESTNESLKKIDEMEQARLWAQRKQINQKNALKVVESYIKKKRISGGR